MKNALVLLAALAVAGTAQAGGKHRPDYAAYAGDAVKEIRYHELYSWERSSPAQLVLWTRPNTAYLVDLRNSCDDDRGARVQIDTRATGNIPGRLQVNDTLVVGQMHCRISGIRELDLAGMKQGRGG